MPPFAFLSPCARILNHLIVLPCPCPCIGSGRVLTAVAAARRSVKLIEARGSPRRLIRMSHSERSACARKILVGSGPEMAR